MAARSYGGLSATYIAFSVLHFICFALALAVCGLYVTDLQRANEFNKFVDSKWVYAVVVGALTAVTCLIYFVPLILRSASLIMVIWDFILFVLWIALFGVFGKMYINENPHGIGAVKRMKNAVWIDLISALLWLFATLATLAYWWKHRDVRSRFTGRAKV